MQTDEILKGEKVTLRPLLLSDCTQEYADWLNDPEVNKYLSADGNTIQLILSKVLHNQSITTKPHLCLQSNITANKSAT